MSVATYRARRRIRLTPDRWREPGELVPEAHLWFRVDSWAHTGWLEEFEADEADLEAAIKQFLKGEDADRVRSLTGLDGTPVTGRGGPRPGYTPARKTGDEIKAKATPRRSTTKGDGKAER